MISRILQTVILEKLFQKKTIIVIGPRQTGKTTLLTDVMAQSNVKSITLNCDDPVVLGLMNNASLFNLRQIVGDNKIVFVDEAQRVKPLA